MYTYINITYPLSTCTCILVVTLTKNHFSRCIHVQMPRRLKPGHFSGSLFVVWSWLSGQWSIRMLQLKHKRPWVRIYDSYKDLDLETWLWADSESNSCTSIIHVIHGYIYLIFISHYSFKFLFFITCMQITYIQVIHFKIPPI